MISNSVRFAVPLVLVAALGAAGSAGAQPFSVELGHATDFFIPAELDRDGRSDPQVWTSGAPGTARWEALRSASSAFQLYFGQVGDQPDVPGDYDGDGIGDAAVYRPGPSAGDPSHWIYRPSSGGAVVDVVWGQNGDFPAPGDYDGDGRADYAVQRSHTAAPCTPTGPPQNITPTADFLLHFSGGGPNFTLFCFGQATDVIVPGDYDNDGKTDLAIVRGVSGSIFWTVRNSSDLSITTLTFGQSSTDFPVMADYDGDGATDAAVWRPSATPGDSRFFVHPSGGGPDLDVPFGQNGDYPVANFNTH